jgi:Circularly permutated YpsA SLOG family
MKLLSGGQTGVDRAVLDVAIECGLDYGGWCPKGGWAEDLTQPPGLLAKYPKLRETPIADPAQRTRWNARDSDACMIVGDARIIAASKGTVLGQKMAHWHRKPVFVADLNHLDAADRASRWLSAQREAFGDDFKLAIGGPRESEAPGIYSRTAAFLRKTIGRADTAPAAAQPCSRG